MGINLKTSLSKLSEERDAVDSQFFSVFKDLMLNERIQNLCSYPGRYKPVDFLSVLKYISNHEQKLSVLKQAHRLYPSHASIADSLLGEYVCHEKWKEAGAFVESIVHLNDLGKNTSFVNKCLVICLHNKGLRDFMVIKGYLAESGGNFSFQLK